MFSKSDARLRRITMWSILCVAGITTNACKDEIHSPEKTTSTSQLISNETAIALSGGTSLPLMSLAPSEVCAGASFTDINGDTQTGTRVCGSGSVPDCTADGQENCKSTVSYRAGSATTILASNIRSAITLGGVLGTAGALDCTTDGELNCLANTNFRAASNAALTAPNIKSGITIGGVAGSLAIPNACTSNGTQSCLVQGTYFAGTACVDLGHACYLPSFDNTTQFKKAVNFKTISDNHSKIRVANSVAGVNGTLPDCNNGTLVDCVTTSAHPSVQTSLLVPQNIKNGDTTLGVTGAYPSATYPLDGNTGTPDLQPATFEAQIKSSASFEYWDSSGTKHTGSGSSFIAPENIEIYMTVFGTTGTLKMSPSSPDVRAGVSVNSNPGSLKSSCRNLAKAAAYDINLPDPVSVTIDDSMNVFTATGHGLVDGYKVVLLGTTSPGGVSFGTVYYVIGSDTSSFQLSTTNGGGAVDLTSQGMGVTFVNLASNAVIDPWDSLDDNTSSLTDSHLVGPQICRGALGDVSTVFGDVTKLANGNPSDCSSTPTNCTLFDKVSGLMWSKPGGTATWANAVSECNGLSHNTYTTGWRLPTFKELLSAYIHGIKETNHLTSNQTYWSATTAQASTANAYALIPGTGVGSTPAKTSSYVVTCVREL